MRYRLLIGLSVIFITGISVQAQQSHDWPQWQGPDRTGISKERGLLKSWPKTGPKLLWKVSDVGGGYSTPSVAGGKVFGMSFWKDDEIVWARDEKSGKEVWYKAIARANTGIGYGEGPRCTPTVDGDLLFALGVSGDLACLESATGTVRWQKSLTRDFGGHVPGWGYCESPLVDGDKLIVTPGGNRATLVALDKKTGNTIWQAKVPQGDGAAYSSIIRADVGDQGEYVQFLGGGVVGIAADSGKFLWRYDHPHNGTANCSTPIYRDYAVFAASGYGTGGGLVRLTRAGEETRAEEAYFTKHMKNHHGGMVLVGDYVYGSDEGLLTCLNFKTGKVVWEDRRPGKGSIAYADGHLYYRNEGGPIFLVEANPKQYVEKGRFSQPDRTGSAAWAHPVIANGKLFIRDQDLLLCYQLKK